MATRKEHSAFQEWYGSFFYPCTPGRKFAQVLFLITDMPVRQESRPEDTGLHGDAGANTDDAGDNTDDPGAMIRDGPCYDPMNEWKPL